MAKTRKFVAYRRLEKPYTRISKFRKKSYIKMRPNIHIVRYDMGDLSTEFPYQVDLRSKSDLQIRHLALESARQISNRTLEGLYGKQGYHIKIRVYPHHVLRENPLAAGAGADRMSTGMKCSFGKPIGCAAQIRAGQPIFTVYTTKDKLDTAKKAMHLAATKLPCKTQTTITEIAKK